MCRTSWVHQKYDSLYKYVLHCTLFMHLYTQITYNNACNTIQICGNKMPTRCNRRVIIADLIACSTCFGHHYAHHQEVEIIIQVVAVCRIWCLVFKLSVYCVAAGCVSGLRAAFTTDSNHLYNTLELLMMGIMVPRNMLSKQ
jgi:hypothetical protein